MAALCSSARVNAVEQGIRFNASLSLDAYVSNQTKVVNHKIHCEVKYITREQIGRWAVVSHILEFHGEKGHRRGKESLMIINYTRYMIV